MITNQENEILDLLAQVYNKFVALPPSYQWEKQEFMHSIHALQNMVWARVGNRSTLPDSPVNTGPYEFAVRGELYQFTDLNGLNKFVQEYIVGTGSMVYGCGSEDILDQLIHTEIKPKLRYMAAQMGFGHNCQVYMIEESDSQILLYCNGLDFSGKPLFNFDDSGKLIPPFLAPQLMARVILSYKEKSNESL